MSIGLSIWRDVLHSERLPKKKAAPYLKAGLEGLIMRRKRLALGMLCNILLFAVWVPSRAASPLGDCSSESGLAGRTDIVFCEPWENSNWWQNGYLKQAGQTPQLMYPVKSSDVSQTSIVSTGCLAGSCLKVDIPARQCCGVSIQWPIPGNQQQAYLRYYIKLAPNFSPELVDAQGVPQGSGGKFPGLADIRVDDPETIGVDEQCGNGGAFADGINCWSDRSYFRNCLGSGNANICTPQAGVTPTTRFGSYLYWTEQQGFDNSAIWDNQWWGQGPSAGCKTYSYSIGDCGIGTGGQFVNDKWYMVETFVKMNTPGVADGILRGWVNGVLSYEKTNMKWRLVGHDNLHVRIIWLNVHFGGEFVGPAQATSVYLDQMVLATNAQIGPITRGDSVPPAPPTNLVVR
jgi:hypothetical protein